MEAISNIRTVAQLTREKHFGDEYCKSLDIPFQSSLKRAHVFGLIFSFTDSVRNEHILLTSEYMESLSRSCSLQWQLYSLLELGELNKMQ